MVNERQLPVHWERDLQGRPVKWFVVAENYIRDLRHAQMIRKAWETAASILAEPLIKASKR